MRMLLAVLAASLGFGAWSLTDDFVAPQSEAPGQAAPHYSLWSEGGETACRFEVAGAGSKDLKIPNLEDCAKVFQPFADASRLVMVEDDGLLVLDAEGQTLVEFAIADGFAMQSVVPASPILSLALSR